MITITDITTTENETIKFSGQINREILLSQRRTEYPNDYYKEIGKLIIDQFNNENNWN